MDHEAESFAWWILVDPGDVSMISAFFSRPGSAYYTPSTEHPDGEPAASASMEKMEEPR